MKTIILCGGKGMRLHQETEFKPKPMVRIGEEPILVHIMKLYHGFGYDEFVLALGYRGDVIKDYFLHIQDYTNNFTFDMRNKELSYHTQNCHLPFKITFVETGEDAASGDRVVKCVGHIPEDTFMLTYGDGVSSVNVNELVEFHNQQRKKFDTSVTITTVHPSSKYGQVYSDDRNIITSFEEKPVLRDFINGGFMVFNKEALSFFQPGEMLETSLQHLVKIGKVSQYRHEGFWHSMDTMKDVVDLTNLWNAKKNWNL
jgi:glucose-1-phosphate cytidylyltransferase